MRSTRSLATTPSSSGSPDVGLPQTLHAPRAGFGGLPLARLARVAAMLVTFVALLVGAPPKAHAAGTVSLVSRELVEEDGRWRLKMTIDYGAVPQLPHIPMIFSFTPTVLYERALTDKSPKTPIINRIPLSNQQGINESMDVGFSDGSGKTFKVTKFDFVIRRDHGFEAGEYDLKIKREDDGVQMGQTIKLVLKGDNVVVDRRAMVFSADKKKKDGDPGMGTAGASDDKKDPAPAADEKKPDDTSAPAAGGEVPAVPPKQGGCGCVVAGDVTPGYAPSLLACAGAALVLARRRRRSSRPSSTRLAA